MYNSTDIDQPPVFAPPPIPNPAPNDRSYQPDVIACCVIVTAIGTVFVALRFYTRRFLLNVLGWEDWFILLAQVCMPAACLFGSERLFKATDLPHTDLLHPHMRCPGPR
jgi:hypothetical protein